MRQPNFEIVYGKLGDHPGALNAHDAQRLFDAVLAAPEQAKILEVGSGTGRATVVLGYAAQFKGSTVVAVDNWAEQDPRAALWFRRAVEGHRLKGTVVSVDTFTDGVSRPSYLDKVDLVVVSGPVPVTPWVRGLVVEQPDEKRLVWGAQV